MAATLAESFLADLEDLSDDEEVLAADEAQPDEAMPDVVETAHFEELSAVATLADSDRYREPQQAARGEADPSYRLVVRCNELIVDIDSEIAAIHGFMRDHYRPRFPELESLVQSPLDYAAVAAAVGNEMDVTLVDLDALLPPATVMVVTVTATTTAGQPLPPAELQKVLDAAALVRRLAADRAAMQEFVQRRMDAVAPNLSAAVGTQVAAQLMGLAGGLLALAAIPACNLLVLGAKRRTLAGFGARRPRCARAPARLVAGKAAILARVDAHGSDPSGAQGRALRDEMRAKIEKWQEPPPARQTKVLPLPDAGENRRRRGGRRYRKMKERYGLTELKKQANRMGFNQPEEEFVDGEDTIGLGVINKEGSGRLRSVAVQQRQKLSAKTAKKYAARGYGSSGTATSGLSSSLAFTPIQGIELANPVQAASADSMRDGTESYFSEYSGFKSAVGGVKRKA
ncbi:hypothetical protein QBZ16_002083 [Prototheca wickerhamii]|uniref:Nop domain-containing protein n=1 Tax=Prototheca wickerhamii TaxID=3111 RepID=A0AAD9IJY1_PROWI|nr:hypothetical protein QBZ16_002083 [Prototheca wickerhamii]